MLLLRAEVFHHASYQCLQRHRDVVVLRGTGKSDAPPDRRGHYGLNQHDQRHQNHQENNPVSRHLLKCLLEKAIPEELTKLNFLTALIGYIIIVILFFRLPPE